MTEIGMALSNPLIGNRRVGYVGKPFPGVNCKILESGELSVKGDTVFKEYWRRDDATAEAFDSEGFFLTGDIVEVDDNDDNGDDKENDESLSKREPPCCSENHEL